LTSFRETLFENYNNHKDRLIKFKESIPILHHKDLADDNTEQLSLAFGWLRSKSWVRLQHLLLVHVSNLWKYDWHDGSHAYDQRLNKESYERLMCKFGMEGDEYECAETLVVTARSRLRELARREAVKLYEKYRLQSEGRRRSDASPEVEMKDSYTKTPSLANANRNHDDANQRLDLESLATKYLTTQATAANDFYATAKPASFQDPRHRTTDIMIPEISPSALVNSQNTSAFERKSFPENFYTQPRDHDYPTTTEEPLHTPVKFQNPNPNPRPTSTAPEPGPVCRQPQLPPHPHSGLLSTIISCKLSTSRPKEFSLFQIDCLFQRPDNPKLRDDAWPNHAASISTKRTAVGTRNDPSATATME
jgi:hypothetical protein